MRIGKYRFACRNMQDCVSENGHMQADIFFIPTGFTDCPPGVSLHCRRGKYSFHLDTAPFLSLTSKLAASLQVKRKTVFFRSADTIRQ